MSDSQKQFQQLVGPSESLRLMGALERGATRRDVLAMLTACALLAPIFWIACDASLARATRPRMWAAARLVCSPRRFW